MTDIVIILVLLCIVGAAGAYVYKAKKSGKKCIGCPEGGTCGGSASSCSGSCAGCPGGCGKAE